MSANASSKWAVERKRNDRVYGGASFTSVMTMMEHSHANKRAHPTIPTQTAMHVAMQSASPLAATGLAPSTAALRSAFACSGSALAPPPPPPPPPPSRPPRIR